MLDGKVCGVYTARPTQVWASVSGSCVRIVRQPNARPSEISIAPVRRPPPRLFLPPTPLAIPRHRRTPEGEAWGLGSWKSFFSTGKAVHLQKAWPSEAGAGSRENDGEL